jgi:hypothetical protein
MEPPRESIRQRVARFTRNAPHHVARVSRVSLNACKSVLSNARHYSKKAFQFCHTVPGDFAINLITAKGPPIARVPIAFAKTLKNAQRNHLIAAVANTGSLSNSHHWVNDRYVHNQAKRERQLERQRVHYREAHARIREERAAARTAEASRRIREEYPRIRAEAQMRRMQAESRALEENARTRRARNGRRARR